MRPVPAFPIRLALVALIWLVWWWALSATLSAAVNLSIIVGGLLLVYPFVWLGRRMLDRIPTDGSVAWTTTFVHLGLGFLLGVPLLRAILTYQDWRGWLLPVPPALGLALVILTGAATLLTVLNLALRGLGAPFFIAISRRLAVDWLYAWTRNPMVLGFLSFLVSLGLWYRSALFVLWALAGFAPALLFFVKVYEERELELRFGASYLDYRSRTPLLFPARPKRQKT